MSRDYKEELDRKKSVINLLMRMASVDGKVDEIEEKFVTNIAQQFGLTTEDIEELNAHPERYEMKPPPPEQERMTILYYVLFTMTVDGQIHKKEEELCYQVGLRLGFNEYLTRDLINVMKRFLNKEVPQEALLNEIKKHLN